MVGAEVCGELEAGHLGHLDVCDEDVRFEAGYSFDGVAAVCGGGDDGDVGFELEERGEGAKHHGLIFGEDDADGRAHRVYLKMLSRVVLVDRQDKEDQYRDPSPSASLRVRMTTIVFV